VILNGGYMIKLSKFLEKMNLTEGEISTILTEGNECLTKHFGHVKAGIFIYLIAHDMAHLETLQLNAVVDVKDRQNEWLVPRPNEWLTPQPNVIVNVEDLSDEWV
jgi:hypothetical protein